MDPFLLQEIWRVNSGKIIGVSMGFVLGMLILVIGFFQALFIFFCMIIGYVIGKRIDDKEDLMEILDKLLPPGTHR